MPDEPNIKRLQETQERRARREREQAELASDPEERQTHDRRAQKAAYLRDKLAEQASTPDE